MKEKPKVQVGITIDADELERMKKATRVDIASQVILSLARLGLEEIEHARTKDIAHMGETR